MWAAARLSAVGLRCGAARTAAGTRMCTGVSRNTATSFAAVRSFSAESQDVNPETHIANLLKTELEATTVDVQDISGKWRKWGEDKAMLLVRGVIYHLTAVVVFLS